MNGMRPTLFTICLFGENKHELKEDYDFCIR